MKPATWGRRGSLIALSLLLGACGSYFGKDAETAGTKGDLTGPLLAAAATAKSQNDVATAVAYYRGALAREPNNVQAAVGLMQSLRMSGGLDEAREVAAKVLAGNPTDPAVLAEAGKVKLATGQLDDAIRLLRQAIAADGNDATSLAALGLAYDRLGQYARADEYYQDALAIAPEDAYVLNNYALSRVMANDLADALKLLQRAAAAPNADLRVRQNLSLVYALSGDMTKAEEQTRRDLPPTQVGEALAYYRQFAAAALPPVPAAPAAQVPPPQASEPQAGRLAALAADRLVTAMPPIVAAPVQMAHLSPATAPADNRPAVPPPAAHEATEHFTIQLGSYPSATSARQAASGFAAKGVAVRLSRSTGRNGRDWFVLDSADFKRRDEAERVLRRVPSMGAVQPLLLRRRGLDAAPTEAAAPAAATRPIVERFTVQLGSYVTETSARRAADRFVAKGVPVTVSRAGDRKGRAWFVVRTAAFDRPDAADRVLRLAKTMGAVGPIVLRHRIADPAA